MQVNIKKIISIGLAFSLIFCVIYFSGILKKNNENTPIIQIKDESKFENKIAGTNTSHLPPSSELSGYGLRLYTREGEFLSGSDLFFKKDKIDFYISFVNANPLQEKFCFFVFLDGKPVEFFVDKNRFLQINYTQSLSAYSLVNIPIRLEDSTSRGKHDLFVVVARGLGKEISKENHQRYFTTCIRKNLVNEDEYLIEYSSNPTGKIKNISPEWMTYNNTFVAIIDSNTDIEGMTQRLKIITDRSCSIPFTLNAIGKPGIYSTVLFIDDKPIKAFDNQYNLIWEINENEMLEHRFLLDNDIGVGQHQVYSITIPIDRSEPILQESEKFLLHIE